MPTSDIPDAYRSYLSYTSKGSFGFAAAPGDRVHVRVRVSASRVPEGSALIAVPDRSGHIGKEDIGVKSVVWR